MQGAAQRQGPQERRGVAGACLDRTHPIITTYTPPRDLLT